MSATLHRLPVDPDLEVAMSELAPVAERLRKLEEDLVHYDSKEDYRAYAHRVFTYNNMRAVFAARAEKLSVRPGSLLLFVEQHSALRARYGRRPSLAQLQRAVIDATTVRKLDLKARLASKAAADFEAKYAGELAEDGEEAVGYLQLCAS